MEEFLICPICGRKFQTLSRHLKLGHKLTDNEIREKFGNIKLRTDKFQSKIESQLKQGHETMKNDPELHKKLSELGKKNIRKYILDIPEIHEKALKSSRQALKLKAQENPEWWKSVRSKAAYNGWNNENSTQREQMHNRLVEQWKNPEIRQNFGHVGGKLKTYKSKKNGVLRLRSWLECRFAWNLDQLDVNYEYESLRFEYNDNEGNKYLYSPDFYLPDFDIVIEIKPSKYLVNDFNKIMLKAKSVIRDNHKFVFITDYLIDSMEPSKLFEYIKANATTIESVLVEGI